MRVRLKRLWLGRLIQVPNKSDLCRNPLADFIDPVVTTIVHPSGSVAITCSAEDRNAERSWDSPESSVGSTDDDSTPDKELDSPEPDSNIKVWSL